MSTHTGFYREAWLVVAQGGWWKPADIFAAMPLGVESNKPHNLLWVMVHRYGYLKSRGSRTSREYAVTLECRTPQGVPVAKLMEALAVRSAP